MRPDELGGTLPARFRVEGIAKGRALRWEIRSRGGLMSALGLGRGRQGQGTQSRGRSQSLSTEDLDAFAEGVGFFGCQCRGLEPIIW